MRIFDYKCARFGVVGAATALSYMALYPAFLAAGVSQPGANAVAFFLAIVLQYIGHALLSTGAELYFDDPMGVRLAAPQDGVHFMSHIYSDTFFDYINQSARASAKPFVSLLFPLLKPKTVIDLGSGRGVWMDEWRKGGAEDVLAVVGDYVDRAQLAVAPEQFMAANLTQPVKTGRRFDLAQSLEVGEHLPTEASDVLVDSLTRASDRVLFSAAVTGQGGEFHVNEQPLSFWQDIFAAKGYVAYDCVRPALKDNKDIAPWYRYNAILYVNEAGRAGLPKDILATQVPAGQKLRNAGSLGWRLRLAVVKTLPRGVVTAIAQARAMVLALRARRAKTVGRAAV